MDHDLGRDAAQLEKLARSIGSIPYPGYLEAVSGAPTGSASFGNGHCRRRHDGRRVWRACVIRNRVFQSLLNMASTKDSNGRPQISKVTPAAAIPGGEFQIRGKGLTRSQRAHVNIGEVAAPFLIGYES